MSRISQLLLLAIVPFSAGAPAVETCAAAGCDSGPSEDHVNLAQFRVKRHNFTDGQVPLPACSNYACAGSPDTPSGHGYKSCPTPEPMCQKLGGKWGPPPMVKKFNFINKCDWDVVLYGWNCRVPKQTKCSVGVENSCVSDVATATEAAPSNETVLELELPNCDSVSPLSPEPSTRVEWYIEGSVGFGRDKLHPIGDFVEVNSPFRGAGTKIGYMSFSAWQGYSMSKSYWAKTVDETEFACDDYGAQSVVPDPIPINEQGEYKCGDPSWETQKDFAAPMYICHQKDPINGDYLKSKAFALCKSGRWNFMCPETCSATEYPCSDQCATGIHNWPAGNFFCNCPEEIVFEVQSCKVGSQPPPQPVPAPTPAPAPAGCSADGADVFYHPPTTGCKPCCEDKIVPMTNPPLWYCAEQKPNGAIHCREICEDGEIWNDMPTECR